MSEDRQQYGWNPQTSQGAVSWNTQTLQGIPLNAWLNPGTPLTVVQEVREAILNYVRSVNNNSGGMKQSQDLQKQFDPNARGTVHAELPGRKIKADGSPMFCYKCQSAYHLAWDCLKNPNKHPQAPKYLNLTHGGNVSSRQNRVNVAQSGTDSSETPDSAEEQLQLLPQVVGCGETQLCYVWVLRHSAYQCGYPISWRSIKFESSLGVCPWSRTSTQTWSWTSESYEP